MGLDDPTKKMSKSEEGKGHAINLLDTPDEIRKKIKRATTDSHRDILFNENRPAIYNLLTIYELFSGQSRAEIETLFHGKGYGDLKKELAEVVIEGLKPLQQRYYELIEDSNHLENLLIQSTDRVRPIAETTMQRVKDKIGLG